MNNGLLVFLSSGAGAALVGFALSSWNLRKQNKAGGEMVISKQITEALLEIQSFERQLRILELASPEKIENIFNSEAKYIPAIFLTNENLFEFQNELSSVLRKQEQFLDIETAAYLNAMEKYLGKLMISFPGITESDLQELGYLLFDDIKRWQSELDQHLIKQINKFSYKLTSLYGKKWDRARNNAIEKYLINSKLMEIVGNV